MIMYIIEHFRDIPAKLCKRKGEITVIKQTIKKTAFLMLTALLILAVFPSTVQTASRLKLNKRKITIYVGKTLTLKVSGVSGTVKWSSKNNKIATVKKSGRKSAKAVAKKAGKTTITVKSGKKSVKCCVTVKNPYLNAKSKTLRVRQTFQLKLTGAEIRSCKSDKTNVTTVSKSGKITARKPGRAVISVKASNGKNYKCNITVKEIKEETSTEKDLSKIGLNVQLMKESYIYTGKPVKPSVRVYNNELYLIRDIDYTVSYANNINVGKAQVTIIGIGKYKGKITEEFEIKKTHQNIVAKLENKTVYVGKTGRINISGAYGQIEFTMSNEGVAKIDNDGTITGLSTGSTSIYLTASGDENHYPCIDSYVGMLSVMYEEASAYGFNVDSWGNDDTYKKSISNSRNNDGTNTYRAYFLCNAQEKWLDNTITFEAEDVTPAAYGNVFADLGVPCEEPEITVKSAADYVRTCQQYGFGIHEPYTEDGPGSTSEVPFGGKLIIVKAGAGVRVVKLTAKKGDTVLDSIYLGSNGQDGNRDYSAYDVELYKKVRRKVEAQIWTDGMSNLEKLSTLADYINETTHYPQTAVTSKEYNPTFWENWAVDDKELLWSMCNDNILNRIMDFQGGIVTCQAAGILETAAMEDLDLPYLYDRDSDTVASGEGVWRAMGSYSSNPSNPWHESLVYKSSDEEKVLLDAQGMDYSALSGKESCEGHGCRDKIISLK